MRTENKTKPWRHLGIVAGGGPLPPILAHSARVQQKQVSIALVEGFADQNWQGLPVRSFPIEDVTALAEHFQREGVDAVTFAGVVRRPDFAVFAPRDMADPSLAALQQAARQGDDALLRNVIALFESAGFTVIGITDIAPDHVLAGGIAGGCAVPEVAREDCQRGAEVARCLGALDIGQSVVVCDGLVLAVEAQEGTAAMLARCAALPQAIRGTAQNRRGVFTKWAKPGQDRRIDLPVVGVDTITAVAAAGLAGLVLEAGAVILLDPEAIIATADKKGLFILGMKAGPGMKAGD